MPIGSWVVESIIRYTSNGVATMERDAAAMNSTRIRSAELRGEITAQEAAWLRLEERVQKANASRMAFLSHASGVGAIAGAAVLGFSIDQAANMERAMLNLQIATHASKLTMDAFKESIYQTAFATAQSAPDIAAIYGTIASTSGLPAKSLTPQFMSMVTKFGEIIQMKSVGTAHEYTAQEAAMQAIELAHQYRAYSPEQIGPFLEMLHKATYFMPGGLNQFVTQSKYYAPLMAMSAGNVDAMQQSIDLGILLQQTGLGRGKGGTSVAAFERAILQGLSMTKFAQGGRHAALLAAGLIDKDGDTPFMRTNAQNQSYFDVIGALAQVQKYADAKTSNLTGTARSHAEEQILRTVFSALGINGSLIAMVAAGGGNLQMRNVKEREKLIPSIARDQAMRLDTFWGAFQRDERGIQSLAAALGGPAITQITPHLKEFGTQLWIATQYLEKHQKAAEQIFDGVAIVTGIAAVGAGAAALIKVVRFIGGEFGVVANIAKKADPYIIRAVSTIDKYILGSIGKDFTSWIARVGGEALAASAPLGELAGALGGLFANLTKFGPLLDVFMGTTSFEPQSDARKQLINTYGYDYWKYLKGRHLGTSPYSYDSSAGDMTPEQYQLKRAGVRRSNGGGFGRSYPAVHVHIDKITFENHNGKSAAEQYRDLINEIGRDPRSILATSGSRRTHARIPAATTVGPR